MRLRKLGTGHSLCFLGPPEVHQSILDGGAGDNSSSLDSKDVLAWTMEQTCQAMEIAKPLRIMQGLEYLRRQNVIDTYLPSNTPPASLIDDKVSIERFWQSIQEDESQTLHAMYGVHDGRMNTFARLLDFDSMCEIMQHLVSEYYTMNKLDMENSSMDNEQEREVAHEIERERQIQRPGQVKALAPSISKGLAEFVKSGRLDRSGITELIHAFEIFTLTTAMNHDNGNSVDPKQFPLFATKDYAQSVDLSTDSKMDNYLRPVNWVLTSLHGGEMVVISPHEANDLMSKIKSSTSVRLHTFSARTNKSMSPFHHMGFYTPQARPEDRKPSRESLRALNLFAGTLYLESLAEYETLCHFLGVVTPSYRPKGKQVCGDGFANPHIRKEIGWPIRCPFIQSPLSFLKHVFSLRTNGQDYDHTHMGFLVGGRAVRAGAFDGF